MLFSQVNRQLNDELRSVRDAHASLSTVLDETQKEAARQQDQVAAREAELYSLRQAFNVLETAKNDTDKSVDTLKAQVAQFIQDTDRMRAEHKLQEKVRCSSFSRLYL